MSKLTIMTPFDTFPHPWQPSRAARTRHSNRCFMRGWAPSRQKVSKGVKRCQMCHFRGPPGHLQAGKRASQALFPAGVALEEASGLGDPYPGSIQSFYSLGFCSHIRRFLRRRCRRVRGECFQSSMASTRIAARPVEPSGLFPAAVRRGWVYYTTVAAWCTAWCTQGVHHHVHHLGVLVSHYTGSHYTGSHYQSLYRTLPR